MNQNLSVTTIIVNWNGAAHLRICLPSLLAQHHRPLEIIVVDNASTDDSQRVADEYGVRWLRLEANIGLARALNRGAALASSDYVLFVNNDMRFDPNFVPVLVAVLERDQNAFAADGMQFNWDGSHPVHLAARLTNRRPPARESVELIPGLYFHQSQEPGITPVFMGSAACMLVRKNLFDRLRGFDERLPLGYEDVELCWRAWIHGWKTVQVPDAVCWHRVGSSTRSREGARQNFRGILQGRLLFATKLLPLRYALVTWFVSAAALAKDLWQIHWRHAGDRIATLFRMAPLILRLLQEKKDLFRLAGRTAEERLNYLLGLKGE